MTESIYSDSEGKITFKNSYLGPKKIELIFWVGVSTLARQY